MRPRTASRLAWSVGIFSIALMIGALVLIFGYRNATLPTSVSEYRWNFPNVLNDVVNLGLPLMGAVLASKRPENRIGWLSLAAGFFIGLYSFGLSYAVRAVYVAPGSLPAGHGIAWIGSWMLGSALGLTPFLFLLFPTGHLPSPRWRPAGWFVAGSFVVTTLGALVLWARSRNEPFGPSTRGDRTALALLALPIVASLLLSLSAAVVRFLGSSGDERLQLKWVATATVLAVATFILPAPAYACLLCSPPAVVYVMQNVAVGFVWVAIAIAVLKYRLYEILIRARRA